MWKQALPSQRNLLQCGKAWMHCLDMPAENILASPWNVRGGGALETMLHILQRRQLRPPGYETTVSRVIMRRACRHQVSSSWPQAHHAEYLWFLCLCRKAALQVSMNDGLSFISSSVIITTTHCVSHHLSFYQRLHCHSHLPGKLSALHSVHRAFIPTLLGQLWAG